MSNVRNIHRIMGATFQHEKPGLCGRCIYRKPYGEWQGYCTVRNKILSYGGEPGARKVRCNDFATLATQAQRLRRRLQRAWAIEQPGTRRSWRLFALINRAYLRELARMDMGI